jgi:AraC family transcriptional regulator, regulatory protein of adaptative response / methylated-DNA-[protein]-cysteine methyltransferase
MIRPASAVPLAVEAAGRPDVPVRFAIGQSSLGTMLVARSPAGVCAILLGDDPATLARNLQNRFPGAEPDAGDPRLQRLVVRATELMAAPGQEWDLPLDLQGTPFQRRVWQALREIPAGQTVSYTEVARRIGAPRSVRAVAQACGANALAVAVPCHRVVRLDGSPSGYRWGADRKRALLAREAGA